MVRRMFAPEPMFLDVGALVLRLWLGGFMLSHGVGKLSKLLNGGGFADPLGIGEVPSLVLAVIGEFVSPIFIILGLGTRLAAMPLLCTMSVAGFIVHANDAFSKKELAFSYAVGALLLVFVGAGRVSVDALLRRRRGA